MAKEEISHKGRIVEITPEFTTVEIVSESACSSCHASSLCGLSEFKKKAVEVATSATELYEVGEEVMVNLKASMGHKAVWVAYVAPLCLLLAVLLGLVAAGAGELTAGLSGIGAVALYYFVIWLLRDTLRSDYVFYIKKIQTNTK